MQWIKKITVSSKILSTLVFNIPLVDMMWSYHAALNLALYFSLVYINLHNDIMSGFIYLTDESAMSLLYL
jgi:hypothetical protein